MTTTPARKRLLLTIFIVGTVALFVYLWMGTGARLPFISGNPYKVSFVTNDAGNTVRASQVRIAGVQVGEVHKVEDLGTKGARITLYLDQAAPLHEGVKFRVGERSLIGEAAVNIVDGKGAELPSGAEPSGDVVIESVQLRDVVASFDEPTRKGLSKTLRSLGEGTDGRAEEIDQLFDAIDILGREGYTAVDALGAQSEDIRDLVREAGTVVDALARSNRDLGDLVVSAETITRATAGQSEDIKDSMNLLPPVERNAREGLSDLEDLGEDLDPVAEDLRDAAPALTAALQELPETTLNLRAVVPDLNTTLKLAPDTLTRVPAFSKATRPVVPVLRETVSQGGPIVGYLSPYGRDLAGFFTNFANAMHATDEVGIHYIRLEPLINEQSVTGMPVTLPSIITWKNPYPAPNQQTDPGPAGGRDFTRLHAAPK